MFLSKHGRNFSEQIVQPNMCVTAHKNTSQEHKYLTNLLIKETKEPNIFAFMI